MAMNNIVKALIVFWGGFIIFFLLKPKKRKNGDEAMQSGDSTGNGSVARSKISMPTPNPEEMAKNSRAEDASISLSAWISAYNNGVSQSDLDDLNQEIKKDYGMNVLCEGNELDGFTITVQDADTGNDIIRYKTNPKV